MFILHGLYGSSDNWVTIAKNLSEKYTVYLPDQRNHGQSPHSDEHNYELMSKDLNELIIDLNIKKLFLVGHSMGGKVAVNFVLKWPEKINSLVIIDVSPFRYPYSANKYFEEHKHILESVLSIDLTQIFSRAQAESSLIKKIESEKTRSFILKNLLRKDDKAFAWKMNVRSLYENLEKIIDGLPRPTIDTEPITGFPVTFVKGEDSDYLSDEEFNAIKILFPAAEMITIKNAGHWVHSERPDAVTEILMNQLTV
jgi:pimeloyl-ACP methyl ester carboxylesterase